MRTGFDTTPESIVPQVLRQADARNGRFRLPHLPYSFDALEPVFLQRVLQGHYRLHSQYVDELNSAVSSLGLHRMSLESMLRSISGYSQEVRFFGGAHWNHSFFWSVMTDKKENQEISADLRQAIGLSFGSLEGMRLRFIEKGLSHHDPGWLWLIAEELRISHAPQLALRLETTEGNDSPLMDVSGIAGQPLLVFDLWSHVCPSGELESTLRRFFAVVNWSFVSALYAIALS